MLRTHTCGELRLSNSNNVVTLSGWVQGLRDKGKIVWIDLRDRYGITQLVLEEGRTDEGLIKKAKQLGREFVIQAKGKVIERYSKNPDMPTGEIEVDLLELEILSKSEVPPFLIEEETDGNEELRMRYRYLDLRRKPMQDNLQFRHKLLQATRNYLADQGFLEVETPYLIRSTPEGARDFVVPSRNFEGQFYALPQSPQTFKQLLMVGGYDRYFQIVRCFRDEDFRSDRQPEFTQIDCEMTFVEQEDVLNVFQGMVEYLFDHVAGVKLPECQRLTYKEAMESYGNDRPDLRFDMKLMEITALVKGKDFKVLDSAEYVGGIVVSNAADYSRKQLDAITEYVKRPQIGAKGLIYVKCNSDGTFKSSVDKFYAEEDLRQWMSAMGAKEGDLLLIISGEKSTALKQLSELRLYMGEELGLRKKEVFAPLWVTDFPLLEYIPESNHWAAMHHPFTAPRDEDLDQLESNPAGVMAKAYDLVINGSEVGGGSIRIHRKDVQQKMFKALGFSEEEAQEQFGFLMGAFEYGTPPHGGIAFGFDRLCTIMLGKSSIRDVIAFPKNNSGRDLMIDAPSKLDKTQLDELHVEIKKGK